ncbi:MAG: leucine-rich repeat domain-containing protein [Ruminococcus sp.]|nr:leucine-rich repeat domain-containing protein [Ruminococcus sp.]
MTTYKKNSTLKVFLSFAFILTILLSMLPFAGVSVYADDVQTGTFGSFEYEIYDGEVCITKFTGEGGDVFIPNVIEDVPVVAIGEEAFWYCKEITSLSMPASLEFIGARAFQGCSSLTEVQLPDSVVEIAAAAFCDCTALEKINVPAELIYVGSFAFDNTPWITRFEDNTSIIIGGRILYKYLGDAEVVNIPAGVTGISGNAFQDKKNLKYVNIPNTMLFIGDYAFFGCDNLKSVSLPDSIYYMGAYSFGYKTLTESGEGDVVEDFVLCANEGTLPADYAKEYGLTLKSHGYFATMDELPEAESCVAKELPEATKDQAKWFSNKNTVITLVIIVISCVGIVGGMYFYFTFQEKKMKKNNQNKKK